MSLVYVQTDSAAPLGVIQACATAAPAGDADASEGVVGGTAGVNAHSCGVPAGSTVVAYATELRISDTDTLASGTLVHRLNISTAQNNLTLTNVRVCRVNSSGVSQEELGAVAPGTDVSAGGVFTQNITLSAASAHNAGDRIYIICSFANSHSMASRTVSVLPNQNIDTPFTAGSQNFEQSAPAVVAAVASTSKHASVTRSTSVSASSILGRRTSKTVSVVSSNVASQTAALIFLQTCVVVAACVGSLASATTWKQLISVVADASASLAKSTSKTFAVSTSALASATKRTSKAFSALTSNVPGLGASLVFLQTCAASVSAVASLSVIVAWKQLCAVVASVNVSLRKDIAKRLDAVANVLRTFEASGPGGQGGGGGNGGGGPSEIARIVSRHLVRVLEVTSSIVKHY